MSDNNKKPGSGKVELLAPAGSYESLRAAVNAGADAVYTGGALFSARAYADNPDASAMKECIDFCHFYGKKIFLALNTLLKPEEIENELESFLAPVYEAGIDAVIVQDTGVMAFISERFGDLPIHISTQAAVNMAEGAHVLRGRFPQITRVVPARELSLTELKQFRADTDLEMEVFIHGALCVSCSGLCLMSSNIGERSGNRGRCAQPCRKLYEGRYLLSPKDQCLLENIPELIGIGIDSFKIEGRMKSPEYTAGCVAVYRKAIDEYYGTDGSYAAGYVQNEDRAGNDTGTYREYPDASRFMEFAGRDLLLELYNRGGFNDGYLHQHNGQDMMCLDRPNHSGTEVGVVTNCSGREASISFFRKVYPGDVIEIRRGNEKVYEFTLGKDMITSSAPGRNTAQNSSKKKPAPENGTVSCCKCLTMKEKRALKGDQVYRTRCEALLSSIRERYIDSNLKIPVDIYFHACENEPIRLRMAVRAGTAQAEVTGCAASPAQKAPLDEATVVRQLAKLNDTGFTPAKTECDIEGAVFVPVSELNRLRREAAEKLKTQIADSYTPTRLWGCESNPHDGNAHENSCYINAAYDNKESGISTELPANPVEKTDKVQLSSDILQKNFVREPADEKGLSRIVSIWETRQLDKALSGQADGLYFNLSGFETDEAVEVYKRAQAAGVREFSFGLPYVCRALYYDKLVNTLEILINACPEAGFLVRDLEEISILRTLSDKHNHPLAIRLDYTLYSMNRLAQKWGAASFTVSPELTVEEVGELLKDTSACNGLSRYATKAGSPEMAGLSYSDPEMIVYGCMPSMISAQCVYKNLYGSCKKESQSRKAPLRPIPIESCGNTFRAVQLCDFCTNIIYNASTLDNTDSLDRIKEAGIKRIRFEYAPGEDDRFTRGHFQKGVL